MKDFYYPRPALDQQFNISHNKMKYSGLVIGDQFNIKICRYYSWIVKIA